MARRRRSRTTTQSLAPTVPAKPGTTQPTDAELKAFHAFIDRLGAVEVVDLLRLRLRGKYLLCKNTQTKSEWEANRRENQMRKHEYHAHLLARVLTDMAKPDPNAKPEHPPKAPKAKTVRLKPTKEDMSGLPKGVPTDPKALMAAFAAFLQSQS